MILSVDWDAFSGCREFVFDAPIWGSQDRAFDRWARWQQLADKRGGWQALTEDFPLYDGWQALHQYAGVKAFITASHEDIWPVLANFAPCEVINIDSHHDLYSQSGQLDSLRPGNWAGQALQQGLISRYMCQYPAWHADLAVCEGYNLERTWQEIYEANIKTSDISLTRGFAWPDFSQIMALVLVQSPSWTNPSHDRQLAELAKILRAEVLQEPVRRLF